jgi:hypothetical protein
MLEVVRERASALRIKGRLAEFSKKMREKMPPIPKL